MGVLIQMCFIHVMGGYVNIAQVSKIDGATSTMVYLTDGSKVRSSEDNETPKDFLSRIEKTCGGVSK